MWLKKVAAAECGIWGTVVPKDWHTIASPLVEYMHACSCHHPYTEALNKTIGYLFPAHTRAWPVPSRVWPYHVIIINHHHHHHHHHHHAKQLNLCLHTRKRQRILSISVFHAKENCLKHRPPPLPQSNRTSYLQRFWKTKAVFVKRERSQVPHEQPWLCIHENQEHCRTHLSCNRLELSLKLKVALLKNSSLVTFCPHRLLCKSAVSLHLCHCQG
jgi:hypothetical protein